MESWQEFKKKIEKSQTGHKADLYARLITWRLSAPLTYLLVRTPLTANQITVFQEILGVVGAFFLVFKDIRYALIGVLVLQIGYIFDCVDGEVARYKGQQSVRGVFLDLIGHQFVIPMFLFFVGVGAFQRTGHFDVLIAGFLAAIFVLRTELYSLLGVINTMVEKQENANYNYQKLKQSFPDSNTEYAGALNVRSGWKWVIKKKWSYPDSMNMLTIAVVLEYFFPRFELWGYLLSPTYLLVYFFAVPITIGRILAYRRFFRNHQVERHFLFLSERFKNIKS
jgi:phosphatidylglycerophosphate synthase